MQAEFAAARAAAEQSTDTVIDPYGAVSPAEFFAVVTESFFVQPLALRDHHRALYGALRDCYRVDPAAWTAGP